MSKKIEDAVKEAKDTCATDADACATVSLVIYIYVACLQACKPSSHLTFAFTCFSQFFSATSHVVNPIIMKINFISDP